MNRLDSDRPRETRRRRALLAAAALAVFSLVCLGWVGWTLADAALVESRQGSQLQETLRVLEEEDPEAERREVDWPELAEGDLVGHIEIERLGVDAIVLAGIGARTLRRGVGYIPGTALPGQKGNVGLAGHRDTFFRELAGAEAGDMIRVSSLQGTVMYQVDTVFVVEPEDVYVLDPPEDGEMLTLVSCYPFYYVGPAPQRFIVQAQRLDP